MSTWDYASTGSYLITVCVAGQRPLLGRVVGSTMHLSPAGRMVAATWAAVLEAAPDVTMDAFVVMPNHLHGIAVLRAAIARARDAPSVSEVVRRFKSLSTRRHHIGGARQGWRPLNGSLWHRGFHDRVLRNEREIQAARAYIEDNPAAWGRDRFHVDGA